MLIETLHAISNIFTKWNILFSLPQFPNWCLFLVVCHDLVTCVVLIKYQIQDLGNKILDFGLGIFSLKLHKKDQKVLFQITENYLVQWEADSCGWVITVYAGAAWASLLPISYYKLKLWTKVFTFCANPPVPRWLTLAVKKRRNFKPNLGE